MPITLDGTLGVGTPGITLAGGAITASANQLNSSAEDVNSENRIINGDFGVWQRGTSFTTATYGVDRWVNGFLGGTVTQSRESFTLGNIYGVTQPTFFLRQSVSGQTLATHYASTVQPIESVRTYAGQTITVIGWARRSSGTGNMTVEMAQAFGSGGSPSADVTGIGATTVTLTGSWAPFAAVMNVPSVAGKTLGTNGNDALYCALWTSAGSNFNSRSNSLGLQTIGVDFWGIHIRVGTWTAADAALYRPRDPGTELALCQRYYEVGQFFFVDGYFGAASTNGGSTVFFKATKRANPGISQTNIAVSGPVSTTPNAFAISTSGFLSYRTSSAAGAGQFHESWTADAEL